MCLFSRQKKTTQPRNRFPELGKDLLGKEKDWCHTLHISETESGPPAPDQSYCCGEQWPLSDLCALVALSEPPAEEETEINYTVNISEMKIFY